MEPDFSKFVLEGDTRRTRTKSGLVVPVVAPVHDRGPVSEFGCHRPVRRRGRISGGLRPAHAGHQAVVR